MTTGPGSDRALAALLSALGVPVAELKQPGQAPADLRAAFDPGARQQRQVKELEDYTQKLLRESERTRADFFWNKVKATSPQRLGDRLRALQANPLGGGHWAAAVPCPAGQCAFTPPGFADGRPAFRARSSTSAEPAGAKGWTGYEVVLDVYPDVFAWGILLVPKDLKPGERRPVVVCQHGLEGVPMDVVNQDPKSEAFRYYKGFAARLAERGFVVFAPHNPYRGGRHVPPVAAQGEPAEAIPLLRHHRAAQPDTGLAGHAAVR